MRIQLIACIASPTHSHEPGEFLEVSEEIGARMVAAGVAIAAPVAASTPEQPEAKAKVKREKR